MSDNDPHRMRGVPPHELERLAIVERQDFNAVKAGAARAELARLQREHAEALVNRQLAAAKAVRHATILAAGAAVASAIGAVVQALAAVYPSFR
jgi:hypothetical protein